MPFEIIRNDIAKVCADVIVNTANHKPLVGSGTDMRIHNCAGPELLAARKIIGRIDTGKAAATPAFNLNAKYVIHTVSPVWAGGTDGEERLLYNCYANSLKLASGLKCESIAFPLLSSGNNGFPKELALKIAVSAFSDFLSNNEMNISLVVYDSASLAVSEKLVNSVKSYIDENLIIPPTENIRARADRMQAAMFSRENMAMSSDSISDMLEKLDAGFGETLIKLIDERGLKDSYVYKKANIDRKLFSKIKNNPDYHPTKQTCIAFCFALELTLKETRDLIAKAGYALSRSSKFDIVIEYFITNGNYDLFELNQILFKFDLPLVGA